MANLRTAFRGGASPRARDGRGCRSL